METAPPVVGGEALSADHLTLRFFAEISTATAEEIGRRVRAAVASLTPFDLTIEGVGAFPSWDRPRVVWRGVSVGSDQLKALATAVRSAVVAAGCADDPQPFVPHVTLFRVRSPRERELALRYARKELPAPTPVRIRIDRVVFVESRLGSNGAAHRILDSLPLGPDDSGLFHENRDIRND